MHKVNVSFRKNAFEQNVELIVVGAGACGLIAGLRAHQALRAPRALQEHSKEVQVLILERDSSPCGSTSLSSGFIPADGTRFQQSDGQSADSADEFAKDIQAKSKGQSLQSHVQLACESIAQAMEWLADEYSVPWVVLDDFLYPGHRFHRMHAVPEKTGEALQARLLAAVQQQEIPVATESRVTTLYTDTPDTVSASTASISANTVTANNVRITGVEITRPDGHKESIGCKALILACNGYGGNKDMVERYIPQIASGLYFGHPGNTGDAVVWGEQLNADLMHLSGYQGHGSVAHPHGMLITWALMMEGGIQVNLEGQRFSNEHGGYSEQAVNVLAQTDQLVWNIYDSRIHHFATGFPDYVQACEAGAIKTADTIDELAAKTGLPQAELANTLEAVDTFRCGDRVDPYSRAFARDKALQPPWYAVKVTGALFHTQGGLVLDDQCRVRKADGSVFDNLFAGGGAACGVSGPEVSGYLSGNGLLTAVAFGFVAGGSAAESIRGS